jgi:hypothetical protein
LRERSGARLAALGSRIAVVAMDVHARRRRLRTIGRPDASAAICALRPFLAER